MLIYPKHISNLINPPEHNGYKGICRRSLTKQIKVLQWFLKNCLTSVNFIFKYHFQLNITFQQV